MSNKFIDTVFYVVKTGHEMGISHQTLGDEKFRGGEMRLDTGQKFINFSLTSKFSQQQILNLLLSSLLLEMQLRLLLTHEYLLYFLF